MRDIQEVESNRGPGRDSKKVCRTQTVYSRLVSFCVLGRKSPHTRKKLVG